MGCSKWQHRSRDMDSEPVLAAATAASIEVTPEQPQPHKWLVTAAVLLGAILTILDGSIVNVALPYMQRSFGVGVDWISWVVTSYLAAVSAMIPMSGWIAVRIGRRRYLLISVVLFVAASALCGFAQSIGQMVVFRVIQGAAGAAMMPLSQAILLETFPVRAHARNDDLRDRNDGRAGDRSDPGRVDHRGLELAVEFLHHRADWGVCRIDGLCVRVRSGVSVGPTRQRQG